MKKLCIWGMVLAMCLGICTSSAETVTGLTYEGPGCATPEEAVLLYLDALRDQDVQGMIGTFAIESYVRHFDFPAQAERSGGYSFGSEIKLPNTNEMFIQYNIESRRSAVASSVYQQFMTMALSDMDIYQPISLTTPEKLATFLSQFDGAELSGFETIVHKEFLDPATLTERYESGQIRSMIAENQAIYGADELRSMAASIEIEGRDYLFCSNVMRYGDRWYLHTLGGYIGMLLAVDYAAGGIVPLF